jgi:molecular chaperone HtpG
MSGTMILTLTLRRLRTMRLRVEDEEETTKKAKKTKETEVSSEELKKTKPIWTPEEYGFYRSLTNWEDHLALTFDQEVLDLEFKAINFKFYVQ